MPSGNDHIFRAYDIRGKVDEDLTPDWVRGLGRALGRTLRRDGQDRALVAHDCRHSSPDYQTAVAQGLMDQGVDVVCLNMVPSPVFYYAAKKLNIPAGVMITASHNPPEYNGFKILRGESTLHTTALSELRDLMADDQVLEPGRTPVLSNHDIVPAYLEELLGQITLKRELTVVVDGGNGAGGLILTDLLTRAGARVIPLFCEPDGDFPNHHPDPVVKANTTALKAAVLEHGADLGLGLDGDADRLGVLDETGTLVYGDRLLAIFARDVLRTNPGATVIGEVKCSHLTYADIAAHGGTPLMHKTGHSMIKAEMLRTGALLAGEMSGHFFFADNYYGYDDALYAALRLCAILAESAAPLSGLLKDWPATVNTPEIRLDCPEGAGPELVDKIRALLEARYTVNDVDGVRLDFPDGWGLVRASNTQPAVVMRFEAESQSRLAEIRKIIEEPLFGWLKGMEA